MKPIFPLQTALAASLLLTALPIHASHLHPHPRVKTGLQVLHEAHYSPLTNRKTLVLTNPTGITPNLDLGVDVMFESGLVDLVGVMGPEHGFRGTAQAGEPGETFVDEITGLTVYDAYLANTTTLMGYIEESGAEVVVFDIQDVGARFYTYIWAMYDTMLASALTNTTFMVLDRPNPVGGTHAFGPVLDEKFASYVGRRAIAQAHGMTAGELARMFVGEGWIREATNGSELELEVVRMEGWRREMRWEDTGLPWVMPSPNMPTPDSAIVYPGTCMFEGTSMSEGRGTTRPFELLGAPFANHTWTTALRAQSIPHTSFRTACFTPSMSKFANQTACGVQTYVSLPDHPHRLNEENGDEEEEEEEEIFDPVFMGINLLWTAKRLFTNDSSDAGVEDGFSWLSSGGKYTIDTLTGGTLVREGIERGLEPAEIREMWMAELEEFRGRRERYLLY